MYNLEELKQNAQSRRKFLVRMGSAGLGAAAFSLLEWPGGALPANAATVVPGPPPAAFPGIPGENINIKVLNFALTLEFLEADLYRQALNKASGKPLTAPLNPNPATYTLAVTNGGLAHDQGNDGFQFLKEFTYAEAAHRDLLKVVINAAGGTAVGPNPDGYKFPTALPANLKGILNLILPLEETGVRAYLGAAPSITDLSLTAVAGGIFSVEARHSAVISDALGLDPGPRKMPGDRQVIPNQPSENTLEYFLLPSEILNIVQVYIV